MGTLYGPTTYYIGVDGPTGFEYELAEGFANYLGVELEIYPAYSLPELFPLIDESQVDFLASGLTITDERLSAYRFGPAYQQVSQKLVYKQGEDRPRELSDLNEGTLMVVEASSHAETLSSIAPMDLRWLTTSEMDTEELFESVLNGSIDYTIADSNSLAVNRRRHPELSIGFTLNQDQNIAWLLHQSQDDSLLALMVEYFGEIRADGSLTALEYKYFGHIRQFNYVDTKVFIDAVDKRLPRYRPLFEEYSDTVDWRLMAALSYQESHWNPRAKSPTGVRGMMMLTLPTAKEMGVSSRLNAEQSIRGGIRYFSKLLTRIPDRIEEPDKTWFAMAAYNLGWGHVEDARRLTHKQGGNPDKWIDVKQRLPLLRQKKYYKQTRFGFARGDEAVTYVTNIRRYFDTLVWLDEESKRAELRNRLTNQLQDKIDAIYSETAAPEPQETLN